MPLIKSCKKPNPKIGNMRFAVTPEIRCTYEKLGAELSKTKTELFDEATALLMKKHGFPTPTREQVAAWFGPEWVKANGYKVKNGR